MDQDGRRADLESRCFVLRCTPLLSPTGATREHLWPKPVSRNETGLTAAVLRNVSGSDICLILPSAAVAALGCFLLPALPGNLT